MEKAGFGKSGEIFLSGYVGDVHGGMWRGTAQGVQPAPGSGWVWAVITME